MSDVLVFNGEALDVLRTLSDESVDMCVTSPPYWGLRSYKTDPLVWDGTADCEHVWGDMIPGSNRGGSGTPTNKNNRGEDYGRAHERGRGCLMCGAWLGSLGLEPTPELYINHLVMIFSEVRRVLRPTGTAWVNIGDTYASQGGHTKAGENGFLSKQETQSKERNRGSYTTIVSGLKNKDLVGIPWMLAFALRTDGWYLRQDIIWHKPNPQPSSVKDRCTGAHEHIFLLSKSQKYYFDSDAIAEPSVHPAGSNRGGSLSRFGRDEQMIAANAHRGEKQWTSNGKRNKRDVWTVGYLPTV